MWGWGALAVALLLLGACRPVAPAMPGRTELGVASVRFEGLQSFDEEELLESRAPSLMSSSIFWSGGSALTMRTAWFAINSALSATCSTVNSASSLLLAMSVPSAKGVAGSTSAGGGASAGWRRSG